MKKNGYYLQKAANSTIISKDNTQKVSIKANFHSKETESHWSFSNVARKVFLF